MGSLRATDGAAMQLSFQILNDAGGTETQNVIFITDDPTYNQITLQMALTSGATQLSPGTIPDPSTPPTEGTTLYVDLSSLQLSSAVWNQLRVSAAGWKCQTFPSESVIGMTPTQPITLQSGTAGAVAFSISGIVIPQALASPQVQLYVSYYNVPDIAGMYSAFAVAIQNRPDDHSKDLTQAINVALSANGIVNSVLPSLIAKNVFSLQFESTQQVVVNAGPDTVFTVSFVYGAPNDNYGFGALTTVTRANQISVNKGLNATQWVITRNGDAQSTSWTLQPPSGAPIVGSGAQAVVAIDFSNVVTTFQPGPTMMLISYANVPGYKDGTYALIINKVAHASTASLSVSPNPTYFSDGAADVTVNWVANGAQALELTQNYQTTPVTGKVSVPATLNAERTVFALKATGAPGTVENTDYQSVTAIALPVINSFAGFPTEVYSGSLSHDATFAWAVDSTDGVTISSTAGAFSGQSFNQVGSTSATILQPQMVTLAPVTAANALTLTRRLVISAFTPASRQYALSFTPTAVAASPTGPFVVLAGPAGSLSIADTIQYSVQTTVSIGHTASNIGFSADGNTLATLNTDNTVSILSVSEGPNGMPVFGSPSVVSLTGTPQQLAFSPKGPRIFVTVDAGTTSAGQLVSLLKSGNTYQVEARVTVGIQPRGVAMDPSGSRLFVANSGDDTVSIVGLTSSGSPAGVSAIHAVTGGPTGIAESASAQQLLVSCAKTGTVVVIDPNHPDTGQRNTQTVGKTPGQIAVTPSGAYAFVVNSGDGTVSLLNCWGLPGNASVLTSSISVVSQPTALAISPDGLQVLVAGASGFSVVTLQIYQTTSDAPSMSNRPTSVEVTPDGSAVFAWHDATIPAVSKSPGILVYTPASATTTNLLASQYVTRCVVSPDPLSKQAFAIVQGEPTLYLIATDTLETSPFSLGLPAGTTPVALAASGDGQALFVLAADANRNLSLIVLTLNGQSWSKAQTLGLYQAPKAGRFLLRSTPDGTTVFLVDVSGAQVRAIRGTAGNYSLAKTVIPGDSSALDLAVLPDGSSAYVLNAGSQNNTIAVIDVHTLQSQVAAIPQQYVSLTGLRSSPDGRRLFATDTNAAALRMLDPQSLRILQTVPLSSAGHQAAGITGLAVMPDGSKIFTANAVSQNLSIVEQIQMGTSSRSMSKRSRSKILGDDDPYSGLFMRHYLGETPGAPSDGWSGSPDVFPVGGSIQPDPTVYTSNAGYAQDFGQNVSTGNANYVYLRGYNTTDAPITSRAYFYYTLGSLAMWPGNWTSKNVLVNKSVQNWVDISAPVNNGTTTNGVGVCPVPLQWTPDPIPPGVTDHYCIIGWVVNGPDPQPPDFTKYSEFSTFDDLVQFVVSHHNMAWRNTVDVTTIPPDYSYNTGLTMKSGGGSVFLTITFPGMPPDGTISINVQGTDPSNSVSIPQSSLANFQGGFSPRNNPLVFPPNFATGVQVRHWPGPTPVPPSAKIKVTIAVQTAPALTRDIERLYKPRGLRTPIRRYGGLNVVIVGSVMYNLLFDATGVRKERAR